MPCLHSATYSRLLSVDIAKRIKRSLCLFQAGPVEAVELLHSLELEPVLEQCKQCQGKVAGCATQILKLMQTTN